MKHLNLQFLTVVFFSITIFQSCGSSSSEINQDINKGMINSILAIEKSVELEIQFYDLDEHGSKPIWRTVRVKNPTGDLIKDTILAFLENTNLEGNVKNFTVDEIYKETGKTVISFFGKTYFPTKEDEEIFKSMLQMTIERTIGSDDLIINWNNKNI